MPSQFHIEVHRAYGLQKLNIMWDHLFVRILVQTTNMDNAVELARTPAVTKSLNPIWAFKRVVVVPQNARLVFEVMHEGAYTRHKQGYAVMDLRTGVDFEGPLPIQGSDGALLEIKVKDMGLPNDVDGSVASGGAQLPTFTTPSAPPEPTVPYTFPDGLANAAMAEQAWHPATRTNIAASAAADTQALWGGPAFSASGSVVGSPVSLSMAGPAASFHVPTQAPAAASAAAVSGVRSSDSLSMVFTRRFDVRTLIWSLSFFEKYLSQGKQVFGLSTEPTQAISYLRAGFDLSALDYSLDIVFPGVWNEDYRMRASKVHDDLLKIDRNHINVDAKLVLDMLLNFYSKAIQAAFLKSTVVQASSSPTHNLAQIPKIINHPLSIQRQAGFNLTLSTRFAPQPIPLHPNDCATSSSHGVRAGGERSGGLRGRPSSNLRQSPMPCSSPSVSNLIASQVLVGALNVNHGRYGEICCIGHADPPSVAGTRPHNAPDLPVGCPGGLGGHQCGL